MSEKRPAQDENLSWLASLPCRRCRSRKVKCDGAFPVCTGCAKAAVQCVIADSTAAQSYTRGEVKSLAERVQHLESLVSNDVQPNISENGTNMLDTNKAPPSTLVTNTSSADPRYVGAESGTSFLKRVIETVQRQARNRPQQFTASQRTSNAIPLYYCAPHSLPSKSDTLRIIDEYLSKFHVVHPFLTYEEITSLVHLICNRENQPKNYNREYSLKLFRLNMVLAIGSIELFRKGTWQSEPFGFFTAALESISTHGFSFNSIQDITNFLLIARFGLLYYIGCSVWEISQICLRISIELNLHRKSERSNHDLDSGQQQRRIIFWDCYQLDRFSCAMLGRPFGIEDNDITVELPESNLVPAPLLAQSVSPFTRAAGGRDKEELAVFVHSIRLSQISSRINCAVHTDSSSEDRSSKLSTHSQKIRSSRNIFNLLKRFLSELYDWRTSSPLNEHPKCVYQTQDWFELSYQREKLALLRLALDQIPSHGELPPTAILNSCVRSASAFIHVYNKLRSNGVLTYTHSFTLHIFSSGLVVLFAIIAQMQGSSREDREPSTDKSSFSLNSWWASILEEPTDDPSTDECLKTLEIASHILHWMSEKMTDVKHYAILFDGMRQGLHGLVSRKSRQASREAQQQTTVEERVDTIPLDFSSLQEQPVLTRFDDFSTITDATGPISGFNQTQEFDPLFESLFNNQTTEDFYQPFQLSSWPFTQAPLLDDLTLMLEDSQWVLPS